MLSGKVLLVDDAPAVRDALRAALLRLGVDAEDILVADTAESARESFQEHRPPVIFMDIDLDGDKGDEVAVEILEADPATKIIVMTGMDLSDRRVRNAVSAGAYEVMQKPLRLARIREVLDLIDSEDKGFRRI